MPAPNINSSSLSDDLVDYVIVNLFTQPRLDSSALIRARAFDGEVRVWLFSSNQYTEITLDDYKKFRRAAQTRGGGYSMELCEFVIEEVMANGDLVLNFWRRLRDDTGEGGRVILSRRNEQWQQGQRLSGWEQYQR